MVKIKIVSRSASDATKMKAKGWVIEIFREKYEHDDYVIAERDNINVRFVLAPAKTPNTMEIKKFVDGEYVDSKFFYDPGCGLCGTLCISEGKTIATTYAFFRNEKLTTLMERYGIKRIEIAKDDSPQFEKFVYEDTTRSPYGRTITPTMPPFHTDGTYEEASQFSSSMRKFLITGASYVYEYNTCTLTIPQKYNVEKLDEILKQLTD